MIKLLNNNKIMVAILMLFAVMVSIALKNENFFDIANYHYYNPWALLNGRIGYDIVPASYLTFLNPLLDFPRYLTILYLNEHINWFYAVNGLWFGGLLFVFYKILQLFFDTKKVKGYLWLLLSLAIAATGRMTWFQVGACTNEIILAFTNLCGLYFLIKSLQNKKSQKISNFVWAGLILGCGLGLKYTNITICVAAGLSLIIGFKWLLQPVKFIFVFVFAGLVGFLLVDGWWMYKMWVLYDNPFFPLLNGIFKSEYFDNVNSMTNNFIPTWKQLAICPYLAMKGHICNAEGISYDYRFPIAYTLAVLWIIYFAITGKIKYYYKCPVMFFFYSFLLIDYLLWAKLFGIQHYFVVIEMFCAVLIVQTCEYLCNNKGKIFYVLTVVLSILLLVVPWICYSFGNLQGRKQVVYVEPIKLPDNTLIKMYNLPLAGLLPEIAKYSNNFRAMGYFQYIDNLAYVKTNISDENKFSRQRDELEKQYKNQIVLFRLSLNSWQRNIIWSNLQDDLKGKKCRFLQNSFTPIFGQPIYICVPKDWKFE